MRIAVYPGSFDPVTNGHIDIIERGLSIFDRIIVAVIKNPSKTPLFPIADRVAMIKQALKGKKNVSVESFDGLLVKFSKKVGAKAIIRGLRAVSDFEYEFQLALTNRKMKEDLETVFLMTDYKYSYLSSSLVREIAQLGGDISGFVPPAVKKYLK